MSEWLDSHNPSSSTTTQPSSSSPLDAILRDVRLRNGAAASSAAAIHPSDDYSDENGSAGFIVDPWDDDDNNNDDTTGGGGFFRWSNNNGHSGSRGGVGNRVRRRRRKQKQQQLLGTVEEGDDDPHHVQALLDVTPQLRFIAPASTDMQGTSWSSSSLASSHSFPALLLPGVWRRDGFDSNGSSIKTDSLNNNHMYTLSSVSSNNKNTNYTNDRRAARDIASLLWVLAHEMSLEEYGSLENEVFASVFALIHSTKKTQKVAGLTALDALLTVPSADDERKGVKFANALSNALRSAPQGDFAALRLCTRALGRLASSRQGTSVDLVESELPRALEWLRMDRSDRRYVHMLCVSV